MNRELEIKVIKKEARLQESSKLHERDEELELRTAMARELHEMGLKTEAIERILFSGSSSGNGLNKSHMRKG